MAQEDSEEKTLWWTYKWWTMIFENVLFILDLKTNLLSLRNFIDKGTKWLLKMNSSSSKTRGKLNMLSNVFLLRRMKRKRGYGIGGCAIRVFIPFKTLVEVIMLRVWLILQNMITSATCIYWGITQELHFSHQLNIELQSLLSWFMMIYVDQVHNQQEAKEGTCC